MSAISTYTAAAIVIATALTTIMIPSVGEIRPVHAFAGSSIAAGALLIASFFFMGYMAGRDPI